MKLKKVATITQEEATNLKKLMSEGDELSYAIHKYNIKHRKFIDGLFSKYLDQAEEQKPYTIRGKGIYTNG